MSKIYPTFCAILISERGKNMMEWNCNHCSSQCLREMEDSVCLFVKDFFRIFIISQGGGKDLLGKVQEATHFAVLPTGGTVLGDPAGGAPV